LLASGLDPGMINRKLFTILKQQSTLLALNDAFLLASYLFLGMAGLVWLAYPTHPPAHPTPAKEVAAIRAEEIMEEP